MPAALLMPPEPSYTNLEGVFHEHKAMIFRAAYRITGSTSEAEDVLQTIFLRLMQRADKAADDVPNPDEKFTAAYMHRAAINCALDIVRRRRRHANGASFDDEAHADIRSTTDTPETAHEEQELRRLLLRAIAVLHPKSAEIFALRYLEGKNNREIADQLRTSPLVIAVTLHRARTRLRTEVGKFLENHHEEK